jgi:hypothetical protein
MPPQPLSMSQRKIGPIVTLNTPVRCASLFHCERSLPQRILKAPTGATSSSKISFGPASVRGSAHNVFVSSACPPRSSGLSVRCRSVLVPARRRLRSIHRSARRSGSSRRQRHGRSGNALHHHHRRRSLSRPDCPHQAQQAHFGSETLRFCHHRQRRTRYPIRPASGLWRIPNRSSRHPRLRPPRPSPREDGTRHRS